MWSNWALPTKANIPTVPHPENESGVNLLTAEQVESWREKGFALVDGLLSDELAAEVHREAYEKLIAISDNSNFGSDGLLEFPCGMDACDRVTLHPNILSAAAQLLNIKVRDLRLTQSDVWMKRGKEVAPTDEINNNSQRVHCGLI